MSERRHTAIATGDEESPDLITLREFSQDPEGYVDRAAESGRVLFITRHGRFLCHIAPIDYDGIFSDMESAHTQEVLAELEKQISPTDD